MYTTGSPTKLKFLGFSMYQWKEKSGIRVHEKPLDRLIDRLRAITSRNRSGRIEWIMEELHKLLNGWVGYYHIADMKKYLERISSWLRRRIRQIHWKRWKKNRTRYENLVRLGIPRDLAWQWANSRKGCWCIAGSQVMTTSMTNRFLEQIGFPNIVNRYEKLRERANRLKILRGTC